LGRVYYGRERNPKNETPKSFGPALALTGVPGRLPNRAPTRSSKPPRSGEREASTTFTLMPPAARLYVPRSGATGRARHGLRPGYDRAPWVRSADTKRARASPSPPRRVTGFASRQSPPPCGTLRTLKTIKTVDVDGGPDGILHDPFNDSHLHLQPSRAECHRHQSGRWLHPRHHRSGRLAPEQAVSDGKGHIYVDIEDKDNIAVIDAKDDEGDRGTTTSRGKGGTWPRVLTMDQKNRNPVRGPCRNPQVMVMVGADDGKVITTLPIGQGTDGAVFNPATNEVFSSQGRRHADCGQGETARPSFRGGAEPADDARRQDPNPR